MDRFQPLDRVKSSWTKVQWILLVVAVNLLIWTVVGTSFDGYDPDTFYYLAHMPFYYYLGFAVVILLAIANIGDGLKHPWLKIAVLLCLSFYYDGIRKVIIEGLFHFDAYGILQTSNQIIREGTTFINKDVYPNDFPLGPVFFSLFKMMAWDSDSSLTAACLIFFTLVTPVVLLVTCWYIARIAGEKYEKYVFPGALMGVLLPAGVLVPSSYAVILCIIFIYIYIRELYSTSIVNQLILLLLSADILLSNPTTGILLMVSMIASSIDITHGIRIKFRWYTLIFGLMFALTLYNSRYTFNAMVVSLINVLFLNIGSTIARVSINSALSGSIKYNPVFSYIVSYFIYISSIALIILLSIVAVYVLVRQSRHSDKLKGIHNFISISLAAYVILFFICFIGVAAFIERPLTFMMIFLGLALPFVMGRFSDRPVLKYAAYTTIIAILLTSVLITGWMDSYNIIPESESQGRSFLVEHPELKIPNSWAPPNVYMTRIDNYYQVRYQDDEEYVSDIYAHHNIYDNGQLIIHI